MTNRPRGSSLDRTCRVQLLKINALIEDTCDVAVERDRPCKQICGGGVRNLRKQLIDDDGSEPYAEGRIVRVDSEVARSFKLV